MLKKLNHGLLLSAGLSLNLIGCLGGGGGGGLASTSPNITVSGALSSVSTASVGDDVGRMTLNLPNLEVLVIYTSGTTVGSVQAAVGADGTWSFTVPPGAQINAIVRDKASLELVGPIVFVDSTNKDFDGNARSSTVTALKSSATLGTITLTSTGKFEVPVAQIAAQQDTVVTSPASKINFSGAWSIAKFDGTLPTGYQTALAVGDPGCPSPGNCQGPSVGDQIYFLKLSGKKFSYSGGNCATYASSHTGTCNPDVDGTTDSTIDIDAGSIWGGATAIAGCGYKLGFARDDAAAGGGLNITAASLPTVNTTQMTFGGVVNTAFPAGWNTSIGGTPTEWAKGTATTSYPMMNCFQVDKTGTNSVVYKMNVCKGRLASDNSVRYSANYGGGCLNADGKPVVIKNWGGLPSGTCTPNTFPVTGMSSNTCAYSGVSGTVASDASFTCTYTGGIFADAAITTPFSTSSYVNLDTIAAGTSCSAILSGNLDQMKCYANYYNQNRPSLACGKEYRFNWNATSTGNFVQPETRDKPKSNYLTNLVTYSADGNTFILEDKSQDGIQLSTGSGSNAGSTFCRFEQQTVLKGTKVTDNKMLVELKQSGVLLDTLNAACVASKNDTTSNSGNGSELYNRVVKQNSKELFYMTR